VADGQGGGEEEHQDQEQTPEHGNPLETRTTLWMEGVGNE